MTQLKLANVRLSFPQLFEAKSVNNGEPRFSAQFLIDKASQSELLKTIRDAMTTVFNEKWPNGAKNVKHCLHEGTEKDYDGYGEDVMFVSASSKEAPHVVDGANRPLLRSSGKPYGGCYVNAVVRCWAQDNNFGKRINAQLLGVQFVKDGEAFGAAPFDPNKAFDNIENPMEVEEGDLVETPF